MREVVMNDKSNLLQLEEHFYQLVDVDEPNTFRNLFPYEEIPKIAFNDRIVPHNMPDEIWITDTTFRDGQQSRAPYTTEQIVTIYDYLHKLGGPKGKIRQSEFFLYSKKDRDAVYKCMERGYQFPEVTSWIRASKQDFQLLKDLGLRETGILVSCSRRCSLAEITQIVKEKVHRLPHYGYRSFTCPTPFKFMHMKKDTYICKCLFLYQQLPILPGRFRPSTFGVCELNFRVRHGYG